MAAGTKHHEPLNFLRISFSSACSSPFLHRSWANPSAQTGSFLSYQTTGRRFDYRRYTLITSLGGKYPHFQPTHDEKALTFHTFILLIYIYIISFIHNHHQQQQQSTRFPRRAIWYIEQRDLRRCTAPSYTRQDQSPSASGGANGICGGMSVWYRGTDLLDRGRGFPFASSCRSVWWTDL